MAVIIPCYNQGQFLLEAIGSVRAQTYAQVGCVVVDDGSTVPETLEIIDQVETDGIQVVRQPNGGLAAARDAGIRATDAPFFVPLDADDRLHPRFIERLLPPLLADATLGYCYSWVQLFGAERRLWKCRPFDPYRLLLNNLSSATAVVRREVFDRAGGYQTDMTHGFEDWDFWLALVAAGYRGQLVPEALFSYRRHPGGSMLDRTLDRREEMVRTMLRHHCDLFARYLRWPEAGFTAAPDPEDELYERLQAAVELERVELSRSWRLLRRLRLAPGAAPMDAGAAGPREHLGRVQSSLAWRALAAIKRTRVYQRYARRCHGPDFLGAELCSTSRT